MDDYRDLYRDGKYVNFFPKFESTRAQQLNAITRFLIYFMIIILIFGYSDGYLYVPIIGIILVIIIHNIMKNDEDSQQKEFDRIIEYRKDLREDEREERKRELQHDGEEYFEFLDLKDEKKPYQLESGNIDSDGNFNIGAKIGPGKYFEDEDKEKSLFTVEELEDYRKNTCRRPTLENPFMNPDITEYNNGDPPAACNSYDEDIKDDMRVNFNHDLFRDVDDLWERKNSQRQFYTTPNTAIPNKQKEFAQWLYNIPKTCKEDGVNCLRYEDLRYKR